MNKYLLTVFYLALLIGLLFQPISDASRIDEDIIEKHRPSLQYQKQKEQQDQLKAKLLKKQEEENLFTSR